MKCYTGNYCQNYFVSHLIFYFLICLQDGTEWIPKDNPKICSKHFVQGEPSNSEDNVDFMPTVFENKSGIENSKDQSQEKPKSCKVKTKLSQSFLKYQNFSRFFYAFTLRQSKS